jgi:dienelactone hydrolase
MLNHIARTPSILRRRARACAIATLGALLSVHAGVAQTTRSAPTVADLDGPGPYAVASYADAPPAAEYSAATIYYPVDAAGPVAGVAISPGFTERQTHIDWWGPRLASHGFAVLVFDTNSPQDRPDLRADALAAAIRTLRSEHERPGSPLFGKVKVDRMGVMGHSMGGGGALIAADRLGDEVRASIPFTPWQPNGDFGRTTAPTLIIAGEADAVAPVAGHSWPHFEALPPTIPRVYLEVVDGDHFIANTDRGGDLEMIGRYGIAWLKLYLDDDESYRGFIFGDERSGDQAKLSRYVAHP